MTQPNFRELALQGDAKAIAVLLNRQLQPQGVTAETAVKKGCLHVLLSSRATVPDRHKFLAFVRQEISHLEPESIDRVKVYGRQQGEKEPVWCQEFGLEFGAYSMLIVSQAPDKNSEVGVPAPPQEETAKVRKPLQRWPFFVAGFLIVILMISGLVFVGEKFLQQSRGNVEKIDE